MEDPGSFVSPVQRRPGVETPHQLDTVPVEVDMWGREDTPCTMYKLQEGRAYNFYTLGNCIEGDNLPTAVDVQFPWEAHPRWCTVQYSTLYRTV